MRCLLGKVILALGVAASSGAVADAPLFKRGIWHVDTKVTFPNGSALNSSYTRCTDPNIELGGFLQAGRSILGCAWNAPARNGNQYIVHEKCSQMNGFDNVVLTVRSDSAYTKTTDEGISKMRDKSIVVAKRVGDCAR
jgi:hypothetical protein